MAARDMGMLGFTGLGGKDRCPLDSNLLVGPSKNLEHFRLTYTGHCLPLPLLPLAPFSLPHSSAGQTRPSHHALGYLLCHPMAVLFLVLKLNSQCPFLSEIGF